MEHGADDGHNRVVLIRHAETEWSREGRHTGRTDLSLTEHGRAQAERTARRLRTMTFGAVFSSPLRRATETLDISGLTERARLRPDLMEWDYGDYEGWTHEEIQEEHPGWEIWIDGAPGGESPEQVRERVDGVVGELQAPAAVSGDVAVFAHGHLLRALAVRWIGLPISAGGRFALGTAAICIMDWKRGMPVMDLWNDTTHMP